MKQRTKKRCFAIIPLSFLLILAVLLGGCGIKGAVAGVDLTPYKEAADGGRPVHIVLWSHCGLGEGAAYNSSGHGSCDWSKEVLGTLMNMQTEKSGFAVPQSFEKDEFFYEVHIDGLDSKKGNDRLNFFFYNEFKQVIIYKEKGIIGAWEVQNPELIKDLFVKCEMYEKKM